MAEKFQNKYRIASTRLQNWDYGWDGSYFVTICTKNREHSFGKVVNGIMHLSHVGIIADVLWYEIKNHARNIELGEFQVMPNHIHGIIIINSGHALSLQYQPGSIGRNRFQNQCQNTLSSIIGSYKSAVTKHVNRLHLDLTWQTRFHDQIIWNERAFQNISEYIKNNPRNWGKDRFIRRSADSK